MSQISVARVQQALTVQAARTGAPSPGAVDNAWGPRTHVALKAFLADLPPDVRDGLYADLLRVPARASTLDLPAGIVAELEELARAYRAPAPTPTRPAPTPAPVPVVRRSSGLAVVAGLAVGALAVGGLAWWWLRD